MSLTKGSLTTFPAIPALVRTVRLLSCIGAVALAATGEVEPIFLVNFIVFFLVSLRIDRMPRLARFLAIIQPFLATLVFGLALLDFFYLSNSFLLAVAHFLLSLQSLRLVALNTNRDNLGGVLLASLMILSASTLAIDWTFFAALCVFLPTVTWALMLHNLSREMQLVVAGQYDLPEKPGRRLPKEEREALERRRDMAVAVYFERLDESGPDWAQIKPSIQLSAVVAFLVAMGCCTVVFFLFPRFNFRGFRGQFLQPVRTTGFTNEVNLETSGRIFTDDAIVMRIEIDPRQRDRWTGYLKGATLDFFDGRAWKKSASQTGRIFHADGGQVQLSDRRPASGEVLHQNIYLESMDSALLFATPNPIRVKVDRPFLVVGTDGSLQRGYGDSWRITYEVDSRVVGLGEASRGHELYRSGAPNDFEKSFQMWDPSMERVQKLAKDITKGAATPVEKATRVVTYLQANYTYTLDLGHRKEGFPIERFLFIRKKGHCEYFASAMCLLLRSVGVPARVVTGFFSNEWNDQGNYFVVRMRHAHAWVEIYVPDEGWISFDPSPAQPTEDSGRAMFGELKKTMDYINLRWNRYVLSYDFERQVEILRGLNQHSRQMTVRLDRLAAPFRNALSHLHWHGFFGGGSFFSAAGIVKGGTLVLGVGLLGGALWFFAQGRRRSPVWFYEKLVRVLEEDGTRKKASQTYWEFFNAARARLGDRAAEADFLGKMYDRARFGTEAADAPEDRKRVEQALARLRQ